MNSSRIEAAAPKLNLLNYPHLLPQEVGDGLRRGAGAAEGQQHDGIEHLQRTGCHRQLPIRRLPLHPKGLNGAFDVLQGKAAKIVKRRLQSARHGFMDGARDHDAAGRRFRLPAAPPR